MKRWGRKVFSYALLISAPSKQLCLTPASQDPALLAELSDHTYPLSQPLDMLRGKFQKKTLRNLRLIEGEPRQCL